MFTYLGGRVIYPGAGIFLRGGVFRQLTCSYTASAIQNPMYSSFLFFKYNFSSGRKGGCLFNLYVFQPDGCLASCMWPVSVTGRHPVKPCWADAEVFAVCAARCG